MHLRHPGQTALLDTFPEYLRSLSKAGCGLDSGLDGQALLSATRIYIGDEFCPHRLPNAGDLEFFFDFASRRQMCLTLLTPFFTDEQLETYGAVFDSLGGCPVEIELVANDLGFLCLIKDRYPSLPLAIGRLLNRGFKDPRMLETMTRQQILEEQRPFLTDCTFAQPEFRALMKGLGIERMERDLLPCDKGDASAIPGFDTSIYFPYGYFTTGRVCWISSFNQPAHQRFVLRRDCTKPCNDVPFLSCDKGSSLETVHNGNTFFYRYTPHQISMLVKSASSTNLRLVYQGYAI